MSARERRFQAARRGESPTQGAHLYFIKMEGSRPVKIGRANQPAARLAALQVASPYLLKLLGFLPDCGAHEYDFHHYLRDHRMLGEWFKWSRMVERTVKIALAGEDWRSLIKEPERSMEGDGWWVGSPLYQRPSDTTTPETPK
jgi:hypothetical protein